MIRPLVPDLIAGLQDHFQASVDLQARPNYVPWAGICSSLDATSDWGLGAGFSWDVLRTVLRSRSGYRMSWVRSDSVHVKLRLDACCIQAIHGIFSSSEIALAVW